MDSSVAELIEWLLDEIAFAGDTGVSITRLFQLLLNYGSADDLNTQIEPGHIDVSSITTDRVFKTKIWDTLIRHSDTVVDDAVSESLLELEALPEAPLPELPQADGENVPAVDKTIRYQPQITVSEDRRWRAITGHPKDPSKLPSFEWECLRFIAAAGPEGIIQPQLVKRTGQDKRSVPRRTDFLAQKGYIEKKSVIAQKQKTSLLTHRKYLKETGEDVQTFSAVHPADLPPEVLNQDLEPVPGHERWTGRILDHEAFARTLVAVIHAFGVIKTKDLQKKLNITDLPWQRKILTKTIRTLNTALLTKTVDAMLPTGPPKIHKNCVKLIREPVEADWALFQKRPTSINHHKKTRRNKKRRKAIARKLNAARADPDTLKYLEGTELAEPVIEGTEPSNTQFNGIWCPSVPLGNLIFELVELSGMQGITEAELVYKLTGEDFHQTMTIAIRSFARTTPQAPLLQSTCVIRSKSGGESNQPDRYYTYLNFVKLIDAGHLTWATSEEAENLSVEAPAKVDEYGFPEVERSLLYSEDGCSTLFEAQAQAQGNFINKKATRGGREPSFIDKIAKPPAPRKPRAQRVPPSPGPTPAEPTTPISPSMPTGSPTPTRDSASNQGPKRRGRPPGSRNKTLQELNATSLQPIQQETLTVSRRLPKVVTASDIKNTSVGDPSRSRPLRNYLEPQEAVFTSYEELQWDAGAPGIYIDPPGSEKPKSGSIGRPRKVMIAVFRSPKIASLGLGKENAEVEPVTSQEVQPATSREVLEVTEPAFKSSKRPLGEEGSSAQPLPDAKRRALRSSPGLEAKAALDTGVRDEVRPQYKSPYTARKPLAKSIEATSTSGRRFEQQTPDLVEVKKPYESPYAKVAEQPASNEDIEVDSNHQTMPEEELQSRIKANENAELPSNSAHIYCNFRGSIGVLCISKDKHFVTLYEVDEGEFVVKLKLPTSALSGPPETVKDRPELRIHATRDTVQETLTFQFLNNDDATLEANNLRARIITAIRAIQQSSKRGARPPADEKPYKCEKCGNSWKNEGGLLYHQTKSRTSCNPKFDPAQPWGRENRASETPKKAPLVDNPDPLEQEKPGIPPLQNHDTEPLVELGPKGTVVLQPIEKVRIPVPISAPRFRPINDQGPAQSVSPSPQRDTPSRASPPENRKRKRAAAQQAMRQTRNFITIDPDSVSEDETEEDDEAVADSELKKPQGMTLLELRKLAALQLQWRKDTIYDLVAMNGGVFPCDRGIWLAMAALWNARHPDTSIPDYRTCKATVALLEDIKKLKKLQFSFLNAKGKPRYRSIIMFHDMDPKCEKAQNLIRQIKLDGSERYVPPEFAPSEQVLRKIEPLIESARSGSVPAGGPTQENDEGMIAILQAPIYANVAVDTTVSQIKYRGPRTIRKSTRPENHKFIVDSTAWGPNSEIEYYFSDSGDDTRVLSSDLLIDPALLQQQPLRRKLPEPITLLQTLDNPAWSFKPFGHGVRPMHARLITRGRGRPRKQPAQVEHRHRPLLLPKPPANTSAVVPQSLYPNIGNWNSTFKTPYAATAPAAPFSQGSSGRPGQQDYQMGALPFASKTVVSPWKLPKIQRIWVGAQPESTHLVFLPPNTCLDETSEPGTENWTQLTPTFDVDAEEAEGHVSESSDEGVIDVELLISSESLDDPRALQWPAVKSIQREGRYWVHHPRAYFNSNSFTLDGSLPRFGALLKQRLPSSLSEILELCQKPGAFDDLGDDNESSAFVGEIEAVAAWEQGPGARDLLSGNISPEVIFINHQTDPSEFSVLPKPTMTIWSPGTAFDVDNFPLDELIREENRVYGNVSNRNGDAPFAERSMLARGRRTLQEVFKTRRVTALPSDIKDAFGDENPIPAGETIEVDYKYNVGNTSRKRTNNIAISPQEEERVMVAVVIIRTLTGGLDKVIDWVLVSRLFPQFTISFIQRRWTPILQKYKVKINKLSVDFQEAFIQAYEAGQLPPIDYDHLLDYDWKRLLDWAMDLVNVGNKNNWPRLPASRERLKQQCRIAIPPHARDLWRDNYFNILTPVHKRLDFSSVQNQTIPLYDRRFSSLNPLMVLAKSVVRANIITPVEMWTKEAADKRLIPFGNTVLRDAISFLVQDKVLMHKNRGRRIPGRSYELTDAFQAGLRKHLDEKHFKKAADFKTQLDTQVRNKETVLVDYAANEGAIMALTNLQGEGRIRLEMRNVPNNKFGLTDGGYQTKTMDKKRLRFEMVIVPTADYIFNEDIDDLTRSRSNAPPRCFQGRLPVWYAINDALIPQLWKKVLGVVLGVIAMRSGISVVELQRAFTPSLESWELVLLLEWCVEMNIMERLRGDHQEQGSGTGSSEVERQWDTKTDGWRVKGWWWLVAGNA